MNPFIDFLKGLVELNTTKNQLFVYLLLLILVCYPFIDKYAFMYYRIDKRIEIYNKLAEIDYDKLINNKVLENQYLNIIKEIDKLNEATFTQNNIKLLLDENEVSTNRKVFQFLSGGLLSFIFILFVVFRNYEIGQKVFYGSLGLISLILLGIIGIKLPYFSYAWINYIGYPVLQLLFTATFLIRKNFD